MEYNLKIDDRTVDIEYEDKNQNPIRFKTGDEKFDVTCFPVSDHQIHMTVNGKGINAYISRDRDGKTVIINGISHRIEDADEQKRRLSRKKGGDTGLPEEITPPMPSVVVRIMVSKGDYVEKGKGVIVVSAMKMESTLSAPFDGHITKINVAEGDKVSPGQVLVDIEAAQ